tara:strand:- start:946 stop:1536 length:591 start_codon:yes stop_codon:yes gene_type:complete
MSVEIFATNITNNIINSAIHNIINKSFYLIKYSSISNSYVSSDVLYKNIINNNNIENYTISDILSFTSKNLKTILPIPILNGKYISEDLYITKLPSKLIIIFVNMNILEKTPFPLSINNSTAINYIMNMINIPPPPINPPPEIDTSQETFINMNKEKYKDEIIILKNMGFIDEHKIIESLIVSEGDVNSAIHYYLR